jgi:hypothetical protein
MDARVTLSLRRGVLVLCAAMAFGSQAAATPIIYPAKGQSPAQTDHDKYACYEWSKAQSSFDPVQPAPAPQPSAPPPTSATAAPANANGASSMTGMVKGAAGGAAVAELADRDTGKGAAVGVLGAAVRERMKQQQQQQQQQGAQAQQQQQVLQQQALQLAQQQSARAQQRATFDRAFAACLEGRGYVVK